MDNKFAVITEQGYPVGQFGFKPLNEEDNRKVLEEQKKADKKNNKSEKEDKE